MANRSVTLYRKVHVPGKNKSQYCRVLIGKNRKAHPNKVEYAGSILDVSEGDFFLGYRNPRRTWERVGNNLKVAQLAAERKRAELASVATGLLERSAEATGRPVQVSLADARDTYLLDLQRTRSGGTYDLFKQTIDEFVGWMSREFPSVRYVHEIRRNHMLAYYDVLAKRGLSLRRGETKVVPASPSTAGKKTDRTNQWIRKVLGLKPGCGPIKRTDLPRDCFTQEEPEAFSDSELQRFFAACNDEEDLLFRLFLHTGLRSKEMEFLTWSDIDFEAGIINIQSKEGFTVKTKESARLVPITDDSLLERLQERGKGKADDAYVWATRTGGRVRDFLDRAKKIGERAGLKRDDVWVHKFRSTCATGLAMDGLGFTAVQQLLGHRDPDVTRRYLAKAAATKLRDELRAVRQQAGQRKLHLIKKASA